MASPKHATASPSIITTPNHWIAFAMTRFRRGIPLAFGCPVTGATVVRSAIQLSRKGVDLELLLSRVRVELWARIHDCAMQHRRSNTLATVGSFDS